MAVHISSGSRQSTYTRIRSFFSDLCDTAGIPVSGETQLLSDWQRTVLFTRKAIKTVGASCRHYDSATDLESRTWNVFIPNEYYDDQEVLNAYINTVETPAFLIQEANHCNHPSRRRKTRHKIVLIQFWPVFTRGSAAQRVRVKTLSGQDKYMYWRGTNPMNHSCLMMLNFEKGTQEFFDPDGQDQEPSLSRAFAERGPFVTWCPRVLPLERIILRESLQKFVQRTPNVSDLCTAVNYLVTLVCLRFGIVNLNLCADLIISAYKNQPSATRNRFVKRFIAWCNTSLTDDAAANFSLPLINPSDDKCALVSKSSGKLCSRKRCAEGGLYCWQHKYFWVNPFAGGQKCSAALVQPQPLPGNFLD
jgi:hypothetical protein